MERSERPGAATPDVTRRAVVRQFGGVGLAALLLSAGGGEAGAEVATPEAGGANLFEFAGSEVTITYAASGLDGRPRFSYQSGKTKVDAAGDEIATLDSPLGRLVTVTVEAVPDLGTTTVTLLVPTVNLEGGTASVDTLAILTTSRTSIAGPRGVHGAVQSYRALSLSGTARSVLI